MGMGDVKAALQRAESVFERRPGAALHEDAAASVRWAGNTRVVASHASGVEIETDMPAELGGSGDRMSPGWLFRASIASCCATSVALLAAARGVELEALEVKATSRSDARGLLGMRDAKGEAVPAGPLGIELHVRIAARDVAPERLRALVEESLERSPMPSAVRTATPLAFDLEVVPR
jgi:uncharacterized OsmC-like protein